jgi:hypothetical protein
MELKSIESDYIDFDHIDFFDDHELPVILKTENLTARDEYIKEIGEADSAPIRI